ncbi:MAG: protein BatD [Bacteroidia bacterium]|nr:MAG: protein BatD [Bacteroidia bacterium]
MKGRYIKLTMFAMLLSLFAEGQEISVVADYPGVVQAGEQFMVSWTINSGGGDFSEPSFSGFYKLMGPQTSYSSSTQFNNGKVTRETTYSYVYYLQAMKEGRFVIPPAAVTIKNKTYYSDSLRIEVVGSRAVRQNAAAATGRTDTDEQVEETGDDIFVNLSLDKRNVCIGEAIGVTVKIYTRVDITGINEIKYPDFEGFLRTDLETPPLTSLQRENINGTTYGTGVVQQFLLYPQFPGEITIDPVQISVLIRQKTGQSDPFFGDFFSTYTSIPKAVLSKPVKIRVNPLPGETPDDFSGIVGKITLNSSLNKDTVNVNDAVTLKMVITGSGNLKLANAPEMKLPADLEVYDPKVTDNLKNGINGTTGQKTFEYLLIPRHYGDFTIPSVGYSYFNVASRRIERITTPELHVYARKGTDQNTGITVYGGVSKEDVKYLGKDIRFISSKSGLMRKTGNQISSKRSFYSTYAFALILFLVILFIRREHIRRNSDISAVRNRKAGKVAGRRLKEAEKCLKENQSDKFYEEILKALWGYLSDKLNIPVSELTRSSAVETLKLKGIDEAEINNLASVIDKCEYARFAPSSSAEEAEKIYNEAARFIRLFENSIG